MIFVRSTVWRRFLTAAVPAAAAAAVLTLMAPTCGTMAPGLKTFARNSIIIPMDVCNQATPDEYSGNGYAPAGTCSQKTNGDVIRAYGLVYQLVRNNIAVYWVIGANKGDVTAVDMTIAYGNGPAVLKYDWATGQPVAGPTARAMDYRGGPFVVDGSDFARASAIIQQYKGTYGVTASIGGYTTQPVNIHVSNVAFQGYVAKTMAGGWSAGGTVPPKLALLNIGSSGAGRKNAMPVIRGYLQHAGLDTAGAAGTGPGPHGAIYDSLVLEDFRPSKAGDWTTTNLYKNGYQVLWVPHWTAPSSCADCTDEARDCSGQPPGCVDPCPCNAKYTSADIAAALATMGSFSAAGKDVFAECAGLGSFEGVFRSGTTTSFSGTYLQGGATTHFQSTGPAGVWINDWPQHQDWNGYWRDNWNDSANLLTGFSSPFMQIGDFPFLAENGAIEDYLPKSYQANVTRFISDGHNPDYDIFTMMPPGSGHGTVVYLAGHSYSGTNGVFSVAGSRLVLNTLFNLGAACVESGVPCNTGQLGECAAGVMSCDQTGAPFCKPLHKPAAEICDGKDNNCNGLVDENLDTECYDGPPATKGVGICRPGVSSCVKRSDGSYGMSACSGEVLPAGEVCNGLDDDCDGHADNVAGSLTPLSGACYTGPTTTLGPDGRPQGICKAGVAQCTAGTWGDCTVCPADAWKDRSNPLYANCQILPQTQKCGPDGTVGGVVQDMTCQGKIECGCTEGEQQSCYDGPPGTSGYRPCQPGHRICHNNAWGECLGEVTPGIKDCKSDLDNDCDGIVDSSDPSCSACPGSGDPSLVCPVPAECPAYPDGTPCTVKWTTAGGADCARGTAGCQPAGLCRNGVRACKGGILGACSDTVLPAPEICDGKDNNCDGRVDENPDTLCGGTFTCVSGVCVPKYCGTEAKCLIEGFDCDLATNTCKRTACGADGICAAGQKCIAGHCKDPCEGVKCGKGATCAGGACTGGGCYVTGCPEGKACQGGVCVTDPCGSASCPAGTFCRAGDCVQSCVYVRCPSGEVCSEDGVCEADRCATVSCEAGVHCVDGACDTACAGLSCGGGQLCENGACVDDPCNLVTCPVGACSAGQCHPVQQPDKSLPITTTSGGGCGGCGAGDAGPIAAVLLLLPFLRRRRSRRPFRGGGALLVIGLAVLLGGAACQSKKTSTDLTPCTWTCPGENRCVDLNFDGDHCGTCSTACKSDEMCEDGVCGPSTSSAPRITDLSPDQGAHGALLPVTVTLTGQRFQDGAQVRLTSSAGSALVSTRFVDSGHVTADLKLNDLPITQVGLRVVNPDRVISNSVPFSVTALSPHIDSTNPDPPRILTGGARSIILTGTGFSSSSLCVSRDQNDLPLGLVTHRNEDGTLTCWFDTTQLPPGTYPLVVKNDGTISSNEIKVTVYSDTPHLDAVTPSVAKNGSIQNITLTGTGFDVTAVVYVNWGAQAGSCTSGQAVTSYIGPGQLVLSQFVMPSQDSAAWVTVKNAGGGDCSNALKLASQGSPPQVLNLTVTPSPLYQGDTATLRFQGSNFPAPKSITVVPPSGPSWTITSGFTSSATSAQGGTSLAGKPDGLYSAYLTFDDAASSQSGSFPFRVLSNAAVLQSVKPAGGMAGTTVAGVQLTALNVRGTPSVEFTGQGIAKRTLTPKSGAATPVVVDISLEDLATGVYQLALVNPSAAASNQVSFSVSPGAPVLTALSPTCVQQSDTRTTLTFTGKYFGAGVSQVVYSGDGGATYYPAPGTVTVTGPTTITVSFDSREAWVPKDGFTDYLVRIQNPTVDGLKVSATQTLRVKSSACP